MTYSDLNLAITQLLSSLYPKINIISNMRVEGLPRPYFYFYMKPITSEPSGQYARHNVMSVFLDYAQEYKDEKDLYDKLQAIRDAFGNNIMVGKESANVMDFDWDLNGADRNTAEVNITLEWFDDTTKPETAETMETVQLETRIQED